MQRRQFLGMAAAALLGANSYADDEPLTLKGALTTLAVYSVSRENGPIVVSCGVYQDLDVCSAMYNDCNSFFLGKSKKEECRKKVAENTSYLCGTADPDRRRIRLGRGPGKKTKRFKTFFTDPRASVYSLGSCNADENIAHELIHGYDDVAYGRRLDGQMLIEHPDVYRRASRTLDQLEKERKTPAADLNLRDIVDVFKEFSLEHVPDESSSIDGKTIFMVPGMKDDKIRDLIKMLMKANNIRIAEKYSRKLAPSDEELQQRAAEIYDGLFGNDIKTPAPNYTYGGR